MPRTRTIARLAAVLAITILPSACNVASTLEPEPREQQSRPPRIVKPKELTSIGTRSPEPLR
jgi:hypothetical protein